MVGLIIGAILGCFMMKGHIEQMKSTAIKECITAFLDVVNSSEFTTAIENLARSRMDKSSSGGLFSSLSKKKES